MASTMEIVPCFGCAAPLLHQDLKLMKHPMLMSGTCQEHTSTCNQRDFNSPAVCQDVEKRAIDF